MQDAKRSIRLTVPESVETSRFPEIRKVLARALGDEEVQTHISYHQSAQSDLSSSAHGETKGDFTLEELETMAIALFNYLCRKIRVLLKELSGPLMWEMGLQLA